LRVHPTLAAKSQANRVFSVLIVENELIQLSQQGSMFAQHVNVPIISTTVLSYPAPVFSIVLLFGPEAVLKLMAQAYPGAALSKVGEAAELRPTVFSRRVMSQADIVALQKHWETYFAEQKLQWDRKLEEERRKFDEEKRNWLQERQNLQAHIDRCLRFNNEQDVSMRAMQARHENDIRELRTRVEDLETQLASSNAGVTYLTQTVKEKSLLIDQLRTKVASKNK
jgi:hypothetical protein